jgi:hypothetical protein
VADKTPIDTVRQELAEAAQAISMAGHILRPHLPLIERYRKERDLVDSVGPIINPSLYKSSERQATDAIMAPIFQAAAAFVAILDDQTRRAREALEKVR